MLLGEGLSVVRGFGGIHAKTDRGFKGASASSTRDCGAESRIWASLIVSSDHLRVSQHGVDLWRLTPCRPARTRGRHQALTGGW